MEGGERFHERLLDEILGVCRVACHTQGGRVELVEEGQRIPLKARAALLNALVDGAHRGRGYDRAHRTAGAQSGGPALLPARDGLHKQENTR